MPAPPGTELGISFLFAETVVVNQLFGVVSGLGMSFLTFDWSNIVYITSPLIVPWWAICNIMVGFVFFYWILVPILYYSNVGCSLDYRHGVRRRY